MIVDHVDVRWPLGVGGDGVKEGGDGGCHILVNTDGDTDGRWDRRLIASGLVGGYQLRELGKGQRVWLFKGGK